MSQIYALQPEDGLQLVSIVLIFGHSRQSKVRFCRSKISRENLEALCFVLETQMCEMTCMKYVHLIQNQQRQKKPL